MIHEKSSLDDVDRMYRNGQISEREAVQYCRKWNSGGYHFTVAVLWDGAIRNLDLEKPGSDWKWNRSECNPSVEYR